MPESNLALEEKRGAPQQTHRYIPSPFSFRSGPVNGRSVPLLPSDVKLLGRQLLTPLVGGPLYLLVSLLVSHLSMPR